MGSTKYIAVIILFVGSVSCKSTYKICVPKQHLEACQQMQEVETKSKTFIECIPARDRMECLAHVQQRQADFTPVDPEDMYVASKMPNQDFVLFQEYRTKDEPDAEFRYEAVIVVQKDLPINNLDQLKGLKSCHTGVNRNVGYKIPLTMLMKRAVFPKMNDQSISPKENELKALSTFFSESCIVGKWSPDPKTNSAWKAQYSKLCARCEHPDKCDYPDNFSGYEGALRCLAHNGGQVAFTKVIYVRKFFGLPVGTIPASSSSENPDEFAYLCVDGSKVPVRNKACSWAARPWQGLLGHNDVLAKISPLREKIKQLSEAGLATKPVWFTKVLGLSEKINHVADNVPIKPVDYLKKANYTEVIERGHGPPEPVVRLCVTSNAALAKCHAMSVFAFSRDIRPKLDCVLQASEEDCLKSVSLEPISILVSNRLCGTSNAALAKCHAMSVFAFSRDIRPKLDCVLQASEEDCLKSVSLEPISILVSNRLCVTSNAALAKCHAMSVFAFSRDIRPKLDCVLQASEEDCLKSVRDNGSDLASVDDKRVVSASHKYNLHPVFHEVYGEKKIPKYAVAVVRKGTAFNKIEDLRGKKSCHNSFGTFSGLDAPLFYVINKRLVSSPKCLEGLAEFFSGGVCLPGVDKAENNPYDKDVSKLKTLCTADNNPSKCLEENRADVAFVSSSDLPNFDISQYELLCLNRESGGRDMLDNFATCNIAVAPSRTWLSAKDFLSDVSIAHTPLSLAQLLEENPELFNIYGEFLKNNNVIFNNAATGLKTPEKLDYDNFKTIHDVIGHCDI